MSFDESRHDSKAQPDTRLRIESETSKTVYFFSWPRNDAYVQVRVCVYRPYLAETASRAPCAKSGKSYGPQDVVFLRISIPRLTLVSLPLRDLIVRTTLSQFKSRLKFYEPLFATRESKLTMCSDIKPFLTIPLHFSSITTFKTIALTLFLK